MSLIKLFSEFSDILRAIMEIYFLGLFWPKLRDWKWFGMRRGRKGVGGVGKNLGIQITPIGRSRGRGRVFEISCQWIFAFKLNPKAKCMEVDLYLTSASTWDKQGRRRVTHRLLSGAWSDRGPNDPSERFCDQDRQKQESANDRFTIKESFAGRVVISF